MYKKKLLTLLIRFLLVLSVFVSADSSDKVKGEQCAGFFNRLKCLFFNREEAVEIKGENIV